MSRSWLPCTAAKLCQYRCMKLLGMMIKGHKDPGKQAANRVACHWDSMRQGSLRTGHRQAGS